MKKTIYLHIGTFKTGTTSIQRYLNDNRDSLKRAGVLFPTSIFGSGGQFELPSSLMREFSSFWVNTWPKLEMSAEDAWSRIFREISKSDANKIIISSENFCDLLHHGAREAKDEYAKVLRKFFTGYEVKVICYLRNLDVYLQSMYGEIIKLRASNGFLDFVEDNIARNNVHCNPILFLDYYAELFGKDNLIVKKYDRKELCNGDVVCDFLNIIGIKKQENYTLEINKSIPSELMELKRIFNASGIDDARLHCQISSYLIDDYAKKECIDPDMLAVLKANAQKVQEQYNIDISLTTNLDNLLQTQISHEDRFLIKLLSLSIKQNRTILQKLEQMEKRLHKKKSILRRIFKG